MEKKVSPAKVVILGEGTLIMQANHLFAFREGWQNISHYPLRLGLIQRAAKIDHRRNLYREVSSLMFEPSFFRLVKVGSQNLKLMIWDTAGQERYHALNQVYYRGAEGKSSCVDKKL